MSAVPIIASVSNEPSAVQSSAPTHAQQLADKDVTIAALQATTAELTKKLGAALYQIDQLARRVFGRSSESYDHPDQLRLELGILTPAAPAGAVTVIPPEAKGIVPGREVRSGQAKRKPIPDTMERVHLPARELPESERTLPDGRVLVPVGEETNERIHLIAPKFVAEVEHCIVYGLPAAADSTAAATATSAAMTVTKVAPPAPQIILGGLPTTALLVQVAFNKFGLHLPLDRQSKEFARLGCAIAKSTMCGWLTSLAKFFAPVITALERQVLASGFLFSDDIPVDMLDPGSGKTKQVRFWSYLGSGPDGGRLPQVLFSFTEDRCGRHPSDMLTDFCGVLMADALAQYDKVVALNLIIRLLCWAHVRREFYQARHTDPRCGEMVILIAKLYAAEASTKRRVERDRLNYAAACRRRWRLRQSYSVPVLALIKERLDKWMPLTGTEPATPDSPLGKAVTYANTRWTQLTEFATTGDLPIDNNPVENAQRPIAVGRKNHLFLGSESGGLVAATCYSLIQSCRLQLIDPVGYLIQVSDRLLAGNTDYDALTPWAIAEAQRKAAADRAVS